jgi:hypothetical protein
VLAVSNHNPNSTEGYEISRDSKFDYQLELAYTTNLPVTYQLYQLTEQAADENADTVDDQEQKGSSTLIQIQRANGNLMTLYRAGNAMSTDDESDKRNREMYANVSNAAEDLSNIVNLGTYDLYETLADGKTELSLSSHQNEDGTVSYDIDYYLIEITPRTDVTFAEYKKETDLVYVIVKALQPRPVAETKEDTESAKATETDNSNTNNE